MENKHIKTFENFHGLSMKNLPNMVYSAMSYEFNSDLLENKYSMLWIKKWIENNLKQIESGLSPYNLSDGGNDFLEVSRKLGCSTDHIIDYIDTKIDEILGY